MIPEYGEDALVSLYVRDSRADKIYEGNRENLCKGQWKELEFTIPSLEGALIDEIGLCFHVQGTHTQVFDFVGLIDDLYADGKADYSIDFANETEEQWTVLHKEISQFTKLKGLMYLNDGEMHLSCSDFAEAYTGRHDWGDYRAKFFFTPLTGKHHMVNVRVQGAIRSYAVGLLPDGKAAILKNDNGYRILAETPFDWGCGKEYCIDVQVIGNKISAEIEGCCLEAVDEEKPYLFGAVGVSMQNGTHDKYRKIVISDC